MTRSNPALSFALGVIGAIVGGVVGYYAFFWIASQGFYALILPTALVGIVAGFCSSERSESLAALCAVAGLALGLFIEWKFAPFKADGSLSYFIKHIHELTPVTLIMLAVGTFLGFRFALGTRVPPAGPQPQS
jgi:hypothetical protein